MIDRKGNLDTADLPAIICTGNMVVPGPEHIDEREKVYPPPEELKADAHVPDFNSYLALYKKSIEEPEGMSLHTHLNQTMA